MFHLIRVSTCFDSYLFGFACSTYYYFPSSSLRIAKPLLKCYLLLPLLLLLLLLLLLTYFCPSLLLFSLIAAPPPPSPSSRRWRTKGGICSCRCQWSSLRIEQLQSEETGWMQSMPPGETIASDSEWQTEPFLVPLPLPLFPRLTIHPSVCVGVCAAIASEWKWEERRRRRRKRRRRRRRRKRRRRRRKRRRTKSLSLGMWRIHLDSHVFFSLSSLGRLVIQEKRSTSLVARITQLIGKLKHWKIGSRKK